MTPLYIPYVEFYITNVCNFNCTGCNRFNNLNFSGQQLWNDYRSVYTKWAQYLDVDKFAILGGEPMTSPDYLDWFEGVHHLWPRASGKLLTNGHYLRSNNHRLYDILHKSEGKLHLSIGLHNENRITAVLDTAKQFLKSPVVVSRIPSDPQTLEDFDKNWAATYHQIKDPSWPDCDTIDQWDSLPEFIKLECSEIHKFSPDIIKNLVQGWKLSDINDVVVRVNYENQFSQGSLKINQQTKKLSLHQSDPIKAHDNCNFVQSKCHHFVKGQLYKCGPVALFPELNEKFGLDLTDRDHSLIHSYRPGDVEHDTLDHLKDFIKNIDHPIDQCKFCPEHYAPEKIHAEHGKKVFVLKTLKNW